MITHPRTYRMLTAYGHSAFKAAEILLDARRHDRRARQWIVAIFRARHMRRRRPRAA